jgi:hypothetical protein
VEVIVKHYRHTVNFVCVIFVITSAALTGCSTINKVREDETLYFVGGFSNWTFEPMRRDANNPYRFTLGRVMTWRGDGRFKFGTETNSWENQFHPYAANASFSYRLVIRDSAANNTWLLHEEECGRAYKMSIDTGTWPMEFVMAPFDAYPAVYLAGDAAGGWDQSGTVAMEPADGDLFILSWHGKLKAGKLSFRCKGYDGGAGPWFEPYRNDLKPDGLEQQVELVSSEKGGADGRNWIIEEDGSYLVVLDQLQEYAVIIRDGE